MSHLNYRAGLKLAEKQNCLSAIVKGIDHVQTRSLKLESRLYEVGLAHLLRKLNAGTLER